MMKKIPLLILSLIICMSLSATTVYMVNTTYENKLLESIGVKEKKYATYDGWYFSKDGIDKTAKKLVNNLPSSEPVILYGISLGGTVARRMTQIAAENGKNVKGYIAQSSPLSGDRLTNQTWAKTSLAMLGGYALIGSCNLIFGLPLESIFKSDITNQDYDFYTRLDDKSRELINKYEKMGNSKAFDRNNEESVIKNVSLPLLDAVFGIDENKGNMFDYFKAVFSDGNNVKDLDPTGDFMVNVMNTDSAIKKEATNTIKRAFIESTNGNLYESSAWDTVKPILNYYQNQRDSYWAKAKKQWWLFAYWSLRSAAASVSVATIEGVPRAWSICVSGSANYSTNDGFVPADDTFKGKKLQMTAPNMRDTGKDRKYTCDKVSHLDYAVKFEELPNTMGRSYSRAKSLDQQQEALRQAHSFVNK